MNSNSGNTTQNFADSSTKETGYSCVIFRKTHLSFWSKFYRLIHKYKVQFTMYLLFCPLAVFIHITVYYIPFTYTLPLYLVLYIICNRRIKRDIDVHRKEK